MSVKVNCSQGEEASLFSSLFFQASLFHPWTKGQYFLSVSG